MKVWRQELISEMQHALGAGDDNGGIDLHTSSFSSQNLALAERKTETKRHAFLIIGWLSKLGSILGPYYNTAPAVLFRVPKTGP